MPLALTLQMFASALALCKITPWCGRAGSRLGTTQAQTKARAHSYTLALHTIATVPSSGTDQELADLPEAKLEYTADSKDDSPF